MVFEDGMLRGIFGAKKDGVSSRVESSSEVTHAPQLLPVFCANLCLSI
jgi:hypothetical protein